MHRNLDRRVEVLVGITNRRHIEEIERMFELDFDEGTVSWKLNDTTWTPTTTNAQGEPLLDLQEYEVQRTAQRRR